MRLWHKDLISKLSNKHILGQHRECAALRGNGWGRKHSTVDYVFTHPYSMLYNYHKKIMQEMINRNYKVDPNWTIISYRGKKLNHDYSSFVFCISFLRSA